MHRVVTGIGPGIPRIPGTSSVLPAVSEAEPRGSAVPGGAWDRVGEGVRYQAEPGTELGSSARDQQGVNSRSERAPLLLKQSGCLQNNGRAIPGSGAVDVCRWVRHELDREAESRRWRRRRAALGARLRPARRSGAETPARPVAARLRRGRHRPVRLPQLLPGGRRPALPAARQSRRPLAAADHAHDPQGRGPAPLPAAPQRRRLPVRTSRLLPRIWSAANPIRSSPPWPSSSSGCYSISCRTRICR